MKNFQHLYLETDSDDVLWLTLDVQNDDFNTLSTAVLLELSHACMQARLHQPAGLILRSAKPDYFSIGISPALLSTLPTPAQALEYSQLGQSVCQQFYITCPTVHRRFAGQDGCAGHNPAHYGNETA